MQIEGLLREERRQIRCTLVVTTRGKQRMLWEKHLYFSLSNSYNITCLAGAVSIGTEMPGVCPPQVVLGSRVRGEFWAGLYTPGRFESP